MTTAMTTASLRKLTGTLFVIAVVAFLVTSTMLSMSFEWPDILRKDAATVLTKYHEGGRR